ncbi:hypothetical protein JCM11491_006046 [Sporobolomyces phaffii]
MPPPSRPPATTVAWPKIPAPRRPLQVCPLAGAPGIAVIDDFLSRETAAQFVRFLASDAVAWTGPRAPNRGEATRTNARFQVDDAAFARRLYVDSGLERALTTTAGDVLPLDARNGKRPVGLNSNIRCYKYDKGSFFGPHYDDDVYDPETGATSEWTLLVYLSGRDTGVKGGETAFYPNPTRKGGNGPAVVPDLVAGRALLHRHGRLCSLHEGRTVEEGTKWVLRSDVMFK